jgi:hypothetical protein
MHGIILQELQQFIEDHLGVEAWDGITEEAGVSPTDFQPTRVYPDESVTALISALSGRTGRAAADFLEDFGRYIVPDLFKLYGALIPAGWKTLDVVENAGKNIHIAVRMKQPDASPPALECSRSDPDEVVIHYSSERKMCGIAVGIAKGVAERYREQIAVTEEECMLQGRPACIIKVRKIA